ncbi:MAG: hypothetical protein KGY56_01695 [Desulfobacterales bacterium]|nr:hypothetical protein [Desulfobacterales bacterium]
MEPFFKYYIIGWAGACFIALGVFLKRKRSFALTDPRYWAFLCKPWRLVTFAVAAAYMTGIAPYSGDYTWDYANGFFMSALTFLFAPWVTAASYKTIKGELSRHQAYVALCLWMFCASWSYDAYNLLRDGTYPATWLSNIGASAVLFIAGGLFWNLDWIRGRGVTFAFLEPDWPYINREPVFFRILGYGVLFMGLVAILMMYFFPAQI